MLSPAAGGRGEGREEINVGGDAALIMDFGMRHARRERVRVCVCVFTDWISEWVMDDTYTLVHWVRKDENVFTDKQTSDNEDIDRFAS